MFLDFYKLREQPFGVTPDPRFLYFGATHREALASLLYAIESKRGFSALVAEPGMGKTSLLFRMLESLHNTARTAFLFQTEGDSRELLRSMLHDLGINVTSQDPVVLHEALNEGLLQELHAGRQVVVVIDEAQNLDEKVLETVRLLSNFETSTQKLMHIVLAGQPGLATKLSESRMTQLRQRVSNLIRLEPFRREETVQYIEHRLRAAGHDGPSIFSADALDTIARVSQGIPRNINSLCFQALSIGFATQSRLIGGEILREVAGDLDFAPTRKNRASVHEPIAWPPKGWEQSPIVGGANPGTGAIASSRSPRSSRAKWLSAIACFALVPISIVALSDSKLGLSDTMPGQASEKVVNKVLDSRDPIADFTPAIPAELKVPAPPPSAYTTDAAPTDSSSESQDSPSSPNVSETSEMPENQDHTKSTTTMQSRKAAVQKTIARNDRRGDTGPSRAGDYGAPTRVQVLRSETLFQFADELYGHSNWTIIDAICAANPQVRGPFSVLSQGQWVQLPKDLVTVTANFNSRAAFVRSR
jgi:type II secretory pathway predicted ATPase ExeA/phage tail protein X